MSKRILVFITIFILALTLVGCKEKTETCADNETLENGVCVEKEEQEVECPVGQEEVAGVCQDIVIPEPTVSYNYGVYNGDFEANMQYWEYYTVDGFHDIDSNISRNGEKSLSIQNGTKTYTSIWQSIDLVTDATAPKSNEFIQFSAYFKAEDTANGTVQIFIEQVINESTKIVLSQSEKETISGTWTNISTGIAEIPSSCTKINIVMIFETNGKVNVDDVTLTKETSNNSKLSMIYLGSEEIHGFNENIKEYIVYLPSTIIPLTTVTIKDMNSSAEITNATSISEQTIITVTASDGSQSIYTVSYELASKTELKYIKLNNEEIIGFNSGRTEYYIVVDEYTVPNISYETYYPDTEVVINVTQTSPYVILLTVTNNDEQNEYRITLDVRNELEFLLPNFDFESAFDWQTWSATSDNPSLSTNYVHGGQYSLKTIHQSSVWKELTFDNTVPQIDDAVKIGAWIYIDSSDPINDFKFSIIGYTENTNAKEVFTQTMITEGISVNEWVYIESTVNDVRDCDRIQFVIENNAQADIYVDDLKVIKGISSNADLSNIFIDNIALNDFNSDVLAYSFLTDGTNIPLVTANTDNQNASVVITQATTIDGTVTLVVTAEDQTVKTYTIQLVVPSSGLLNSISLNNVPLIDFSSVRNSYYIVLPSTTTTFPTITAEAIDTNDTIVVEATTLPGYATITVTTIDNIVNTYYVYVEVENPSALSTPYPDINFDKNLENWGVSNTMDVYQTSELFLNGNKSLKMDSGEAWVGFDLAGGDYPSKGNTYSVGMWVYVTADVTTGFRVKLIEKENNLILINEVLNIEETNQWIYIETQVSLQNVSQAAGYLQIVITNETGGIVFVDALRLIEHDPVTVVEDVTYTMSNVNLNFEDNTGWGFWSPTGTGVSYDSTTVLDLQSLKMSEGSAWIGFGFDGPGYPAKGDNVKIGFWIYVDSQTATSVGGFTIKLVEKEGTDPSDLIAISYTTSHEQFVMDQWVYVETSTAIISDDPAYLQIVIEEGTDGTVYVDNISVIQVNN